jgi:hypothetical protein
MARIHSPLCHQSASFRMRQERRDRELAALFGRHLVEQAHGTDAAELDLTAERMDAVHDAADELLAHAGDTLAQNRIVRSLDPYTRLILCMWVMDLGLAAKLAAQAIRRPVPLMEEVQ